jgi:hypothetical protein
MRREKSGSPTLRLRRTIVYRGNLIFDVKKITQIWKNDFEENNVFWTPNGKWLSREGSRHMVSYHLGNRDVYATEKNRSRLIWYTNT